MSADVPKATGGQLLDAAGELIGSVVPGTRGVWPRTAAFLIRLALEESLDELWAGVQPGLADCAMRAQILCLPAYAGEEVAGRAAAAWSGLSQACHYHAYELAPTAAELRHWHDEVAEIRRQTAGLRAARADLEYSSHHRNTPTREGT